MDILLLTNLNVRNWTDYIMTAINISGIILCIIMIAIETKKNRVEEEEIGKKSMAKFERVTRVCKIIAIVILVLSSLLVLYNIVSIWLSTNNHCNNTSRILSKIYYYSVS